MAATNSIPNVIAIPLDQLRASPTVRRVDEANVARLAASIEKFGLFHPIIVRKRPDGLYEIRGGYHRVLACIRLRLTMIPVIVRTDNDVAAAIVEIDENFARAELTAGERATAMARRKVLYEELNPATRHGRNQHTRNGQVGHSSNRQDSPIPQFEKIEENAEATADTGNVNPAGDPSSALADRFTKATAEATGISERAIRRDAARGQKLLNLLGDETMGKIARTSLDKGTELDALVKLSEEKRAELVERAAAGEMVSARAVLADTVLGEREEAAATRQGELGGRFNLFLADPLWPPAEWPGMARALSDVPDAIGNLIASRPVASLATEDAVLLLWSPAVMFPWALAVMEAWGFGLRAHLAWARTATEPGQWARVSHDVLLIGSRGRVPAPAPGLQPESVQYNGESARSAFGFTLSCVFPELRERLDLFGTQRPPEGWNTWEGA